MVAEEEPESEWLELFLVDLAGARQLADAVPALVDKLHIDSDYLLESSEAALARIGHPQAARLIREAWTDAEWDFCNFASGVLGQLKHLESEETILALLDTEEELDLRTMLCLGLCKLYSERGVEVVLQQIEEGEDEMTANLSHEILPVLDVLGIKHPRVPEWRRDRAKVDREMEAATPHLEKMLKEEPPLNPRAPLLPPEPEPSRGFMDFGPQVPFRHETPRVGRNDPCPCGSGKKFKQCCGRK
jgi:hypothetical protein